MIGGGSRISQHIRGGNHPHSQTLGLGFCSGNGRFVHFSSLMMKPTPTLLVAVIRPSHYFNQPCHYRLQRRMVFSSSLDSKSHGETPVFSDSVSQPEGDLELCSQGLSPVAGGIVALGKFDALHVGHRELAIEASKVGTPYLLSFVGMAEVLGWGPRTPIVAKCYRARVLSTWATFCGGVIPSEFQIKFSSVRHLSPRQFVHTLSNDLGVRGVVAGENYRFGYKAAGDASEMMRLCDEYGIKACIISCVMDKQNPVISDSGNLKDRGQVSSTRVRAALAQGDITYVSKLLGRPHRLIMKPNEGDVIRSSSSASKISFSIPKACTLNLLPKEGLYHKCSLLYADERSQACQVLIDSQKLYLEFDGSSIYNFERLHLLGIEFGD